MSREDQSNPTTIPTPAPTPNTNESKQPQLAFVDIGANLLDEMYQGKYRGKERHGKDLDIVLTRAFDNHVQKIIITCGTLQESKNGLQLARTNHNLFCTVGVHPTRCSSEFGTVDNEEAWEEYLLNLQSVVEDGVADGKVVALGEMGLDYARLEFCDVETQKKGFIAQLNLAKKLNLPIFLHNRESGHDLLEILKEHYFDIHDCNNDDKIRKIRKRAGGVVHSFDDTIELAQQFIDLGLYIGINGCSLKKEENLKVVKDIPMQRILLETDCPWCDIRATHAGYDFVQTSFPTKQEKKYEKGCCVKGRYEPIHIIQVAEVVAGVKGISVEEVARVSSYNAHMLFGSLSKKR